MRVDIGSTWRKWDLHVHTPESHTATYGGGDDAWDRFLQDLRSLPPELSVLGINDYMTVAGYRRVLEAHRAGDLPGIEAVFPVIELRLADFIGTEDRLSRLNAHAIFAPGTDPILIETQFLASLASKFELTDKYQDLRTTWQAVPTHSAIIDLGQRIKSTVPPEELKHYGSDFVEGFNNWVVSLSAVKAALGNTTFSESPLLALGKTEWESIPWNDNTIASKKNLISGVDLLFTAAMSASACQQSVDKLKRAGVNHRVLDCSDAHHYSFSDQKDRVGNCSTWICADPTLAGLKHALLEYRSRVYVGDKPELLVHQETDPTNFISRITIRPTDPGHKPAPRFNVDLSLNGGFVAVIGNKGSGKSALLDSLALAANSHAQDDFTFLSERRYRNPRNNKAPHFQVSITTADGETVGPVKLSSETDLDTPERIRYLPQSLLERLCNKVPGSTDDAFETELRSIIFSHVPEHERLGCGSLDELLRQRGLALDKEIDQWRAKLSELNKTIAGLEDRGRPSRLRMLNAGLRAVREQLASHDAMRPPDPAAPEEVATEAVSRVAEALTSARSALSALDDEEVTLKARYTLARERLDGAANLLRSLRGVRTLVDDYLADQAGPAAALGLNMRELVDVTVDENPAEAVRVDAQATISNLNPQLAVDGVIAGKKAALTVELKQLEAQLDEPRRRYEQDKRQLQAWTEARARLVGSATEEGTEQYFVSEIAAARTVPSQLQDLRRERLTLTERIHGFLHEKLNMYRELYGPVQRFLESNEMAKRQFSLEFEADLEIVEFTDRFLSFVDRSAVGTFYGIEPSTTRVQGRVKATISQDWTSISRFVSEHDEDLRRDRRGSTPGDVWDSPGDALRKGVTLAEVYDYLFGLSYVEAHYELRSDGRTIAELSPGQKGTILLMFYLLVDQSGRPIALDQPDENLDSHTIHTLLRPAIRAAKAKRQVFVVTHSPNLAVVGDADQVIVATCDGDDFAYCSGSIENPEIRDLVVEVLEGTWPAFTDRQKKYSATEFEHSHGEMVD